MGDRMNPNLTPAALAPLLQRGERMEKEFEIE